MNTTLRQPEIQNLRVEIPRQVGIYFGTASINGNTQHWTTYVADKKVTSIERCLRTDDGEYILMNGKPNTKNGTKLVPSDDDGHAVFSIDPEEDKEIRHVLAEMISKELPSN
jgi:hypothetical protein